MQISCSKRGILNSTHMLQMPPTYPRSPLSHQQLRLCSFLYLNLHKIFEFTMPLNENLLPLLTLKRISAKKDSSWLTGLTSQPESNSHCSQRSLIHAAFQEKKHGLDCRASYTVLLPSEWTLIREFLESKICQ